MSSSNLDPAWRVDPLHQDPRPFRSVDLLIDSERMQSISSRQALESSRSAQPPPQTPLLLSGGFSSCRTLAPPSLTRLGLPRFEVWQQRCLFHPTQQGLSLPVADPVKLAAPLAAHRDLRVAELRKLWQMLPRFCPARPSPSMARVLGVRVRLDSPSLVLFEVICCVRIVLKPSTSGQTTRANRAPNEYNLHASKSCCG